MAGGSKVTVPEGWIDATDVALILEGGGMRASYTAGALDQLLARKVQFGWVGGISAGASHAVSYLSYERDRVRSNFVDFAADPQFGGWKYWLRGKGFFHADYIYGHAWTENIPRPYEYARYESNPAHLRIGALRADTGEDVYFGERDIHNTAELFAAVRASSSLPLVMPSFSIDGIPYADGGFMSNGGIPLDAAEADGFTRFFALLTHPRGFVRPPLARPRLSNTVLRRYPAVAAAMAARADNYNATLARLLRYEAQGRALVFTPTGRLTSSTETDVAVLRRSLDDGIAQARREWVDWARFLGVPAS